MICSFTAHGWQLWLVFKCKYNAHMNIYPLIKIGQFVSKNQVLWGLLARNKKTEYAVHFCPVYW